jgi:hypothetical protein
LIPCWRNKTWHHANKKKNNNILDLKHIKVMPSLVPQVTQVIFNYSFSMKDFHTNHNELHWFGYNILHFVPIELKINLLSRKIEYCNFLINYMYEASHIAYTKIANLEGEFIDLNVLSKHQMHIVPSWSCKDNCPSLMYEWHHNDIYDLCNILMNFHHIM